MGHGTEPPQIHVPPITVRFQILLFHAALQDIQPLLALAATDDLAYLRHQYVHGSNGFVIVINAHIEWFNRAGIVRHDYRPPNGFFRQVAFVFRLQILPPTGLVLEFPFRLLQQLDRLRVRDALKVAFDDAFQCV